MTNPMAQIDGISFKGFSAPVTVEQLHSTRCDEVRKRRTGIYVVLLPSGMEPHFLPKGSGGWFKGQSPNYRLKDVEANWVEGATVLYVGKAAGQRGLHGRIDDLVRFGLGKPVGHRGGRLLWQLEGSEKLEVRWREWPKASARPLEKKTIKVFKDAHDGKRPFANLTD